MLDIKGMSELMIACARAGLAPNKNFSYGNQDYSFKKLHKTLTEQFAQLEGKNAHQKLRQNMSFVSNVIENTVDAILPEMILSRYGDIAEYKNLKQNETAKFNTKITAASRRRAKKFIGKVGINGLQEVFRVEGSSYEIATNAIGGAYRVQLEELLDGTVDPAELLNLLLEGMDEAIFLEIAKQLDWGASVLKAATSAGRLNNYREGNGFEKVVMDDLLSVADSYGGNSSIYCTEEFARTVVPENHMLSNEHKNDLWKNGYFSLYGTHKIIAVKNSLIDETNRIKVLDPSMALIVPGDKKPVKIATEGDTIMKELQGADYSTEFHIYKKVGVGCEFTPDVCIYKNTALKGTFDDYSRNGNTDNDLSTFNE